MERAGLTKNEIMTELARSPHGDFRGYMPVCTKAAATDQEFFAHFISYASAKSQIRDMHIALPVIALSVAGYQDEEYLENAYAHIAKLSPKELITAHRFAEGWIRNPDRKKGGWLAVLRPGILGPVKRAGQFRRLIARYLRAREENQAWLERSIVTFRRQMQELYFTAHIQPSVEAKAILYDRLRPCGSSLEAIAQLRNMQPREAAASIIEHRIPFLTISSTLGSKTKNPEVLMAMIGRMSPTELQTNMKLLEKLGVKEFPQTRAALEEALVKLARSTKTTFKTGAAIAAVSDEKIKDKLRVIQKEQVKKISVDGNWAVLVDMSQSQQRSIEVGKYVAAALCSMVKGSVHMVFFNSSPRYYDATGKSLEEIQHMTRNVEASGNTSIGCAMQYASKFDLDGVAIISDGGENRVPSFTDAYRGYCGATGKEPTVYYYIGFPGIRMCWVRIWRGRGSTIRNSR